MAESFHQLPADGSGKSIRTYKRGAATSDPHDQYVVPTVDRIVSAMCSVATFRLTGAASSPTNLFTLENTTGSTVLVALRRLAVLSQFTATTAYLVASDFRLFRGTTVPSGGSTLTQHLLDTAYTTPPANVVARGPASADGTAAAITYALPAGNPMTALAHPKLVTGVGYAEHNETVMWRFEFEPIILRAAQSLLLALVGNSAAGVSYSVQSIFEVFTRP